MNERWIKLRLHPEHRRVAELAAALWRTTVQPPVLAREIAFCMAVRWFRFIDEDMKSHEASYDKTTINVAVRAERGDDFAAAAVEVGWLKERNGLFKVAKYDKYLSERHKTRERVRAFRKRNSNGLEQSKVETEETRRESSKHAVPSATSSGGIAGNAVRERAEMLRAFEALGIAKNLKRSTWNRLDSLPNAYKFLKRIIIQGQAQGLTEEGLARYVYGAIRSEADGRSAKTD
jgi:hypothetical protein